MGPAATELAEEGRRQVSSATAVDILEQRPVQHVQLSGVPLIRNKKMLVFIKLVKVMYLLLDES